MTGILFGTIAALMCIYLVAFRKEQRDESGNP